MCIAWLKLNAFMYAVNWILNHDKIDKDAIRFSNYVTEKGNEVTPLGVSKKYLEEKNQLTSGEYNLQVVV